MHENIFFWYICIFVTLRRKPGILNTRFVFLQYKNTKKKPQKNTQKDNNITRFFRGWVQLGPCGWAEPSRHSRVTGPNQWPGWAQRHAWVSSRVPWLLLFKWIKFHLNSNNATKNACKLVRKERQLTWSAGEPDFFSPHCLRSPAVLSRLCSFRFILLPFLFSPSPPFCFPFSQ
jgi:hypothetical protein